MKYDFFLQNVAAPLNSRGIPIEFSSATGSYLYSGTKKYIDFMNSKGSVLLGHNFKSLNKELIKFILKNQDTKTGFNDSIFSLKEKVFKHEKYPYIGIYKTGGQAIDALIHSLINREKKGVILSAGYHGSSSLWLPSKKILSPNNYGVIDFYYSLDFLVSLIEKYKGKIIGVIISPDKIHIGDSWYKNFNNLIVENNLKLIADEVKSGYRYNLGSLCNHQGLSPDFIIFSKCLANGWPISLVLSKEEKLELPTYTAVFDYISIAAAIYNLDFLEAHPSVYKTLENNNKFFLDRLKNLFKEYNFPIKIKSFGSVFQFIMPIWLENEFYSRASSNGLIFYDYDNQCISISHTKEILLEAVSNVKSILEEINKKKDLKSNINKFFNEKEAIKNAWRIIDGLPDIKLSFQKQISYVQTYREEEALYG
jgi:glutamate-1-semialdehyde aminotransferase